jgi:hypothetical protein
VEWESGGSGREKEEDWAEGRLSERFFMFLDFESGVGVSIRREVGGPLLRGMLRANEACVGNVSNDVEDKSTSSVSNEEKRNGA